MLLLHLTPRLIYLKLKKIKGPKTHSLFHFHFHFHNLLWRVVPRTSPTTINFCRVVPRTSLSTITFVESYLVPRYRRARKEEVDSGFRISDPPNPLAPPTHSPRTFAYHTIRSPFYKKFSLLWLFTILTKKMKSFSILLKKSLWKWIENTARARLARV